MKTVENTKPCGAARAALRALALASVSVAGVVGMTAPAFAQDVTSGSLSGTVVDDTGKPVQGATVTVTDPSRGTTRTVTTNSSGGFTVTQLQSAPYTVTVAADGFSTTKTEGVAAVLGGASYTFAVTPASGGDDIVVTGSVVRAVDFSGTATGIVVDVQQTASRLPIARSIEAIQMLAPQTTTGDSAFGGISIGGSSVAENIYYINGMNVTNFRTFVGGTTVPFEFYDQVQVKTGGYQAEFGRNTGGAVIALTRSGTNDFKGGANIYWEPNKFNSVAPNTYAQNNSKDIRDNIEGNVWVSGPIVKDRLFFFAFFNPRNKFQSDTSSTGVVTDRRVKEPFFGGKVDFNIIDGHRLEATYFSDSQDERVLTDGSPTTNYSGGSNIIVKYTGNFYDWMTVSALWGKSKFNQTSAGADDGTPYVLDGRIPANGLVYVAGNPNGTIETGADTRENMRIDADFLFSGLGEHHVRVGADFERLTADAFTIYSGGIYNRYYRTGAAGTTLALGTGSAFVPGNTDYIRVRNLQSGGNFKSENLAFYIQDDWDLNDRVNLSLGLRNDRFKNLNALETPFTDFKNQWAPRLGINYDVFGDKRTKLSAFWGRYYLPIAANTNIRLAGAELFTEDFYLLNAANYTGDLNNPTLGTKLGTNILSDGTVGAASTLVSKNLKPQYMDEFIVGLEHKFGGRWTVGVTGTYRKLNKVLEDMDFDGSGSYRSLIDDFCNTQSLAYCNPTTNPSIGGGGYVLINPGADLVVDVTDAAGGLHEVTIPNSFLGVPKAKREYYALELKADRAWDGVWSLSGSYVWTGGKGNYEGGVKSDNGQDDTGLTQDFDELGWTDGSYGYLPNFRRHTFKLFGAYSPIQNLTLGVNALLQSGRKFGCQGTYPLADGRATGTLASSWYCDAQIAAGNIKGTLGKPVGRGTVFEGDWNKRIDVSASYKLDLEVTSLTLRADVFNLFNWKSKLDFNEFGDLDAPGVINPNYGKVTSYQTPRYVRFSASLAF